MVYVDNKKIFEIRPKKRRRKLICMETYTVGSGDDQTFGCKTQLPMDSANKVESENAAARIMQGANAQLEHADSTLRLVMYDVKLKKVMKVFWFE